LGEEAFNAARVYAMDWDMSAEGINSQCEKQELETALQIWDFQRRQSVLD
jgi:hypothetical protein